MATQVTLVALYGQKGPEFATFLAQCQTAVADTLGSAFTAYDIDQVHATIVGLERQSGSRQDNNNFAKLRNRSVAMELEGFLAYVRGCGPFPLEVQLGGFSARDYPFTSRQQRPYERSFSIQGDKVVVVGWPIRGEPLLIPPPTPEALIQESHNYPSTLDQLRHAVQRFGILHGYHRELTDVDNDLFFRIGLIDPKSVPPDSIRSVEQRVRKQLSEKRPLILEVTLEQVLLAAYVEPTLPVSSTQTWSVTAQTVDGQFVAELYK